MDNNKKLAEGLLKADGIDPAGATESERIAFGRMLDEQSKLRQSKPGITWPDVWRIIMKHKLTRLAAAAVIMIAVILVLNNIGGPGIASVALADVARRLEGVKNCVFRKTVTVTTEEGKIYKNESHIYFAQAGVRQDNYHGPDISLQVYLQHSQRRIVWMVHDKKLYDVVALTDEDIDNQISGDPKDLVKEILSKGEYRKLGKKSVDGVLAEGFAFNDKRTLLSMEKDRLDDVSVRIWADVNTNLPIRIEMDCIYNGLETELVMCDPKWDVELKPNFFEPKIPDGYIKPEERGLIGINLENWPALKVVAGMPAEKAGIKDGDVVLKVDDKNIPHDMPSGDALNLLSGKAGEKVTLTVKREEQILTFEIEREPSPE